MNKRMHYAVEFLGEKIIMSADFALAASQINMKYGDECEFQSTGYQVADFRHRKNGAMRSFLEEYITCGGDSAEDYEKEIDAAVGSMEEIDPEADTDADEEE